MEAVPAHSGAPCTHEGIEQSSNWRDFKKGKESNVAAKGKQSHRVGHKIVPDTLELDSS